MSYYFPSFITSVYIKQKPLPELKITVNSGTNALQLLLRSFNLNANDKIAIPAFVCDSVKNAVRQEKLLPILFDLKPDNSFWTSYDLDIIKAKNIKAIILVHLYGFVHPDTIEIADYCEENDIKLIHDAAQSYGIDEKKLVKGSGIVYSFGPGKSTTAAGGAWIKTTTPSDLFSALSKPTLLSFQNVKAKLFFKSRVFGYKFNWHEKLLGKILNNIQLDGVFSMSDFQLEMASYSISNVCEITPLRKKKFNELKEAVIQNPLLNIAYDDAKGLNFKMVLFLKDKIDEFRDFLEFNNIPYFMLFKKKIENKGLLNFDKNASNFLEISCESSIPESEIGRIAALLINFK